MHDARVDCAHTSMRRRELLPVHYTASRPLTAGSFAPGPVSPGLVQIGSPIRMQYKLFVFNTYQSIHDALVSIRLYWFILVCNGACFGLYWTGQC